MNPPSVVPELLQTPLCPDVSPVRIVDLVGQHSGLLSNALAKVTPWETKRLSTFGMYCKLSQRWSSVRIRTMFWGGMTVKESAEVAVPSGVTTVIGPLVAPDGTVAVRLVSSVTVNEDALSPANWTSVAFVKSVPETATWVPTAPCVGVKLVIEGACARAGAAAIPRS